MESFTVKRAVASSERVAYGSEDLAKIIFEDMTRALGTKIMEHFGASITCADNQGLWHYELAIVVGTMTDYINKIQTAYQHGYEAGVAMKESDGEHNPKMH